jgi:hypothetical protein
MAKVSVSAPVSSRLRMQRSLYNPIQSHISHYWEITLPMKADERVGGWTGGGEKKLVLGLPLRMDERLGGGFQPVDAAR